jgi:GST-like protein
MKLYGCPGCGSAAIEAMLQLAGIDYAYVKANVLEPDETLDELKRINPLGQVPALLLDDGSILTESAAIMLWLCERMPMLVPRAPAARAQFYRWMIFVPANLYAVFAFRDFPARWVEGAVAQAAFKEKTAERLKYFWGVIESSLQPAPYALGNDMTALDIYLAMVSRWTPGRAWIAEHCPKLAAAVDLTEQHPVVAAVWKRNFAS